MSATDIAVGLGEIDGSGRTGIATIHDNGDATVEVAVYMTTREAWVGGEARSEFETPGVDAKAVDHEWRAVVRPLLRDAGLGVFRGRTPGAGSTARPGSSAPSRSTPTSPRASGAPPLPSAYAWGCTSTRTCRSREVEQRPSPLEHLSTFRYTSLKRLRQPWSHPWGQAIATDRRDVWFVREDGSDLAEVVADAGDVIATSGLRQLEAYRDPLYAYCALLDYERHWPPRAIDGDVEVIPSGAFASPRWQEAIGLLGRRTGRDPASDMGKGFPAGLVERVLGR